MHIEFQPNSILPPWYSITLNLSCLFCFYQSTSCIFFDLFSNFSNVETNNLQWESFKVRGKTRTSNLSRISSIQCAWCNSKNRGICMNLTTHYINICICRRIKDPKKRYSYLGVLCIHCARRTENKTKFTVSDTKSLYPFLSVNFGRIDHDWFMCLHWHLKRSNFCFWPSISFRFFACNVHGIHVVSFVCFFVFLFHSAAIK